MDATLERVWARWCARRVVHLWDAPEVMREWLDGGDEALREEALALAWEDGSGAAAWATAWSAEQMSAMWVEAKSGMWAAREAKWEALEAGWSTERTAQQRARDLITTLSVLLPEHGLSALRIDDEALDDRWLTREVWRALGLPDLEVVCDWAGGAP